MSRSVCYSCHRTSPLHSPSRSERAPSRHGGARPASARPSVEGQCRIERRGWPCSLWCILALLLAAPLRAAPTAATPTMVLQVGHSAGITALAYSPDGRTLATGGDDGVRLWDVASGQLKAILQAGSVVTLAFSPDGKTLATGSHDYATGVDTVRLWDAASGLPKPGLDAASGQLKTILQGRGEDVVIALALSPDSKTLATESWDSTTGLWTMRLWDLVSGRLKATLKGAVWPPAFAPDGQTLATRSYPDQTVQLWDVASGQLKATLKDAGRLLAFSTDGKTLATRDGSGHLQLWDVALASPIIITAQTSLAQFPSWLTHPFSLNGLAAVSLLDPFDEHVLATMQALPDAPASLFAPLPGAAAVPSPGGEWITTTPDGYFEGSANLALFIRWSVDGVLYPAAAYWDVYYRPDLVQQALRIPGE